MKVHVTYAMSYGHVIIPPIQLIEEECKSKMGVLPVPKGRFPQRFQTCHNADIDSG